MIVQLCLSSVCTHHMRYIKDICIIQEWPWYWYSTNKSVYHHKTPRLLLRLLWNKNRDVCLYMKRREQFFNYVLCLLSVCTHRMWFIKDICIIKEWPWYWYSTKKSVQHPRMSKFLLKKQNGTVRLAINRDERFFNYFYQVCARIICDL